VVGRAPPADGRGTPHDLRLPGRPCAGANCLAPQRAGILCGRSDCRALGIRASVGRRALHRPPGGDQPACLRRRARARKAHRAGRHSARGGPAPGPLYPESPRYGPAEPRQPAPGARLDRGRRPSGGGARAAAALLPGCHSRSAAAARAATPVRATGPRRAGTLQHPGKRGRLLAGGRAHRSLRTRRRRSAPYRYQRSGARHPAPRAKPDLRTV